MWLAGTVIEIVIIEVTLAPPIHRQSPRLNSGVQQFECQTFILTSKKIQRCQQLSFFPGMPYKFSLGNGKCFSYAFPAHLSFCHCEHHQQCRTETQRQKGGLQLKKKQQITYVSSTGTTHLI